EATNGRKITSYWNIKGPRSTGRYDYHCVSGDPTKEALKDSCQDLMMKRQHVLAHQQISLRILVLEGDGYELLVNHQHKKVRCGTRLATLLHYWVHN
ncbi:hypothetical protein M8C21_031966, partial [Ambrosia artemisiifolia]